MKSAIVFQNYVIFEVLTQKSIDVSYQQTRRKAYELFNDIFRKSVDSAPCRVLVSATAEEVCDLDCAHVAFGAYTQFVVVR